MKAINELIEMYLEDKKMAWAESTIKSERHRLQAMADALDGNPHALWNRLSKLGAYSRVTAWTRTVDFWDFALASGERSGTNEYRVFRKKYAKQFKNVYQPRPSKLSFEQALERIEKLEEPSIRAKALHLLSGGLRYTESFTQENGEVLGKGGKRRSVFSEMDGPEYTGSYHAFWRALATVGLKPHELRKIAATTFAREGLREADLCEVMGWNSFNTARCYLAPLGREALKERIQRRVQGGTPHGQQQGHRKKQVS